VRGDFIDRFGAAAGHRGHAGFDLPYRDRGLVNRFAPFMELAGAFADERRTKAHPLAEVDHSVASTGEMLPRLLRAIAEVQEAVADRAERAAQPIDRAEDDREWEFGCDLLPRRLVE